MGKIRDLRRDIVEEKRLELAEGWKKILKQKKELLDGGKIKDGFRVYIRMPLLKGIYILKSIELLSLDNELIFDEDISLGRFVKQQLKVMRSMFQKEVLFETFSDLLEKGELRKGVDYCPNEKIAYFLNQIQGLQ
jgi:hypothetical protein